MSRANTTVLLLCILVIVVNAKPKHTCPIGFNLAYTRHKEPICYRLKEPESFGDKFEDCAGNLYTSKLYHSLNIPPANVVLWAEYKSLYPGGPFIDWSYTSSTGDILVTTYDVNNDGNLGIDEELCVVIDPVRNFTATRCNEKHYRYCFVEPYPEGDESQEGCEALNNYWRLYSPRATCLTSVTGVGGGGVRATWSQAQELCAKRGGSLLHRGWRYANDPLFHTNSNYSIPLGIVLTGDNLEWFEAEDGNALVPDSEWSFRSDEPFAKDKSLVALHNNSWQLVDSTHRFYDVICERSIHLRNVSMNVFVDLEGKLTLRVNDTLDKNDIYCFSDSVIYFPTSIKLSRVDDSNEFILTPAADGYYWCIHVDSENFHVTESNKALFIREKQSLINFYSVKFQLKNKYTFENLENLYRKWEKKLNDYIFYRTKYVKVHGDLDLSDPQKSQKILESFKRSQGISWKEKEVIQLIKLKRLYFDGRTAMVHVALSVDMSPVPPGIWDSLEVIYMKPVYYCKGFDTVPTLPLGKSHTTAACRTYTCVGDFTAGVQWVITTADGCVVRTPATARTIVDINERVTLLMPTVWGGPSTETTKLQSVILEDVNSTSEEDNSDVGRGPTPPPLMETTQMTSLDENSTEMTTLMTTEMLSTEMTTEVMLEMTTIKAMPWPPPLLPPRPTTTTTEVPITARPPPPPEEQLQQVLEDLEVLLSEETVTVESINSAFGQVDELLDLEDELDIPSQLLHMLDKLGARAYLNGSQVATAVRNNIAMIMADAAPDAPVTGLRIAATDDDVFTEDAFQVLTGEVNSSDLASSESEAVVNLPSSVAASSRRISFVVFRNDRAFHDQQGLYSVNSRVLSIKIEDYTNFEHGEVIDIHLRPLLQDLERNETRSCAYWSFIEDGTGQWSQDGCTFIPATQSGMLDTCRCDHLTHFAEVLVPRTVFSERNEHILEVISIIGCCMSIIGLLMVGITAALFRSWRRDFSNKIWLQLCLAVLLLVTCFLVVCFANFQEYDVACMLVGVALHYSTLASFCWMLVAAVLSYRRLVLVFTRDASHKLLRASAFSWGAPCAVVGILLSIDPHSYGGRFEEKTPSGSFCYPSGTSLWVAVYAPIALMLLANWTLFALIVRSVFASRRIQRHGDSNEALRCASVSCLLVFLFGLPWIFGLFAYNVVAAYFFTLTATFQGFVLFIFFVVGNKKTRDLWLNKLKIKQTRKIPVTSSTYTNKSSGTNWRGGPAGAASMEANSSKPRSLASPDASRFS